MTRLAHVMRDNFGATRLAQLRGNPTGGTKRTQEILFGRSHSARTVAGTRARADNCATQPHQCPIVRSVHTGGQQLDNTT